MRVHSSLGCGFLEIVYDKALAIEFERVGIAHTRQASLPVTYENQPLGTFNADYLVEEKLILELTASTGFTRACHSQLLNYLRASNLQLGLLLNFGTHSLQIKRKVNRLESSQDFKQT